MVADGEASYSVPVEGRPDARSRQAQRETLTRRLLWLALPWLTAIALLALWETIAEWSSGAIDRSEVPPPSAIAVALAGQLRNDRFWSALEQTLEGWSSGLAAAFLVAVPLGLAVGSSRRVYRNLRSLVDLLRPIPGITLLPLLVLLVGLGSELKFVLVAIAAFWPQFIQTLYGVQDVDPVALEMARTFGLGGPARFWRIVAPSSAPYVVAGFRIAATAALNVGIAVELLVGGRGIGSELNVTAMADRIPTMYAYVVAACLLGLTINLSVRRFERRLLHWHPSQRVAAV